MMTSRPLSCAEHRCGGLSNGVDGLGAESWPKVQHGSQLFLDVLQESMAPEVTETDLVERLFKLLTWVPVHAVILLSHVQPHLTYIVPFFVHRKSWRSEQPPRVRGELRNTIQIAPLQIPFAGSADDPLYGTRLSSVILVHRDGSALVIERDIWTLNAEGRAEKADPTSERTFRFKLETPPAR